MVNSPLFDLLWLKYLVPVEYSGARLPADGHELKGQLIAGHRITIFQHTKDDYS